jgi:hypothetical protein
MLTFTDTEDKFLSLIPFADISLLTEVVSTTDSDSTEKKIQCYTESQLDI